MIRLLILLLLLPLNGFAMSASELFAAGKYEAAAQEARKLGSAEGDALAARATLTIAAYQAIDRARAESLIDQAIADAKRGEARDAASIAPLLQEAVALGYRAKLQQSPKQAKRAKAIMLKARQMAPNDPIAIYALGAWHGEPIADLGSFIARTVLGAKLEEAMQLYDKAMQLDPANTAFPVFTAFNLYRIDPKLHGRKAMALLEQSQRIKPRDAFEAMIQARGKEVLTTMAGKDSKATALLIRRLQPFGAILAK